MSYLLVDGHDLSDLIYAATEVVGGIAPAVASRALEETPTGPPRLAQRLRLSARSLTVTVDVRPNSLTQRQAIVDQLGRWLSGVRALSVSDAPARVWYGEGAGVRVRPVVNAGNPIVSLELEWTIPDPRRWDVETQTRVLSTTPVAVPTGTGVSQATVRLFGASTAVVNPSVVVRAPSGAELARLTLTGSLGSNTWLDIDTRTQWLHLVSSGTRTGALAWLAGGAFPVFDGADAAGVDGPFPSIALEASSGTPTGLLLYRRSWH